MRPEKFGTRSIFVGASDRSYKSSSWATVGELLREGSLYTFRYTAGAYKLPGVALFPGLPDLDKVYQMEDLFPIFKNRLLSKRRPEYKKWLSWGGFDDVDTPDAIAVLGTLGSRRTADSLELFTGPLQQPNWDCYAQFFLHGVRHHVTAEVLEALQEGEKLIVRNENDNPYDHLAVAVDNSERRHLGYVPRFLTTDIRFLSKNCPDQLEVTVKRANIGAPSHYQILCQLHSSWPAKFLPCTGGDFERIAQDDSDNNLLNKKQAL